MMTAQTVIEILERADPTPESVVPKNRDELRGFANGVYFATMQLAATARAAEETTEIFQLLGLDARAVSILGELFMAEAEALACRAAQAYQLYFDVPSEDLDAAMLKVFGGKK